MRLSGRNRVWFKGAQFHVISRGIRRTILFHSDEDREMYLDFVKMVQQRYPFNLHSYCIMPNHVHLQIETIEHPLSKIMQAINAGYARYFNKKHRHSGYVFERRYKSFLVTNPRYELELSRYIHLNPIRAGLAEQPEEYRWSSIKAYCRNGKPTIVTTSKLLSHFPPPQTENYLSYLNLKRNSKTPSLETNIPTGYN
ncbi:transposase [Bacillus sp. EB01]|uniref:transposase n=1 Tax=Bacillus sp. EB01 TaxID=1347086 RepID=UPI0005C4B2CF|nr:transposase [Bacillus sp. EB01]